MMEHGLLYLLLCRAVERYHAAVTRNVCLQCFDTVGWVAEKASTILPVNTWTDEVLEWLSVWSQVQMTCMWSS